MHKRYGRIYGALVLIDRYSRDVLCDQLRRLRNAAIDLERDLLIDCATPKQLAVAALGLRERTEQICRAAEALLPTPEK